MGTDLTLLRTTENAQKIQSLVTHKQELTIEDALLLSGLTKQEFKAGLSRLEQTGGRKILFDGRTLKLNPLPSPSEPTCRHCGSADYWEGDKSALTGDPVRFCRSCGSAHPPSKPIAVRGCGR